MSAAGWFAPLKNVLRRAHGMCGYSATPAGKAFLDAKSTVSVARRSGMSVCDYLEGLESDTRKRGRRDRIIGRMREAGAMNGLGRVCEIGPGTGRYMEKVIAEGHRLQYETYETDAGWREYLRATYGGKNGCLVSTRHADGVSLSETESGSCDLVHAHAVFVYLPLLQSVAYVEEMLRVCKPGGYVVFDYFAAESFDFPVIVRWLNGPHRWPVLIPSAVLKDVAQVNGCVEAASFAEVYGDSYTSYVIWRKSKNWQPLLSG